MVPPIDIILEIGDQLLRRRERIGIFFSAQMPMIAFAGLIVVSQNAFTTDDVSKPVFEIVRGPNKRLFQTPQYQLRKGRFRVDNTYINEFDGFHVGNRNNIPCRCQSLQQYMHCLSSRTFELTGRAETLVKGDCAARGPVE
jgi:hypothetical protein